MNCVCTFSVLSSFGLTGSHGCSWSLVVVAMVLVSFQSMFCASMRLNVSTSAVCRTYVSYSNTHVDV